MQRIQQPPLEQPLAAQTDKAQGELVVDIEGAVAAPGVHRLPTGSLVEEAIAAAGGLTEGADHERLAKELNRADQLKDHQKIYIPSVGEAVAASEGADGKVNLNTATKEELEALPGIGPATADKIIAHRELGGFSSIEDLKEVSGIGESKFESLRDHVTV